MQENKRKGYDNKHHIKGKKKMKLENKRGYLGEKGITLIALVVTIVVLLILAGVSVNALFGNSGIIEKAKEAQNAMDKAKENDEKGINELTNWIDNQVNGTTGGNTGGDTPSTGYVFTLGSNTYQAEEGMTWRQWVNSEYNTIGMRITTKPSKYGISNGYCIAYAGTDTFETAFIESAFRGVSTKEIMTVKGEHTESRNDLFDILAVVNKRCDFWVRVHNEHLTGQLNAVKPDDVINAPGGGYNNPNEKALTVGDGDLYKVKDVTPQYCTIHGWND